MPELPEVETIRRQLEPLLTGRRVTDAGAFPSMKFTAATELVGQLVTGVTRRGKYLIMSTDRSMELVVHLGMTGQLAFQSPDEQTDWQHEKALRAWWALDDLTFLTFRDVRRFGRIAFVPSGHYESLPTLHRIGPEPFDPSFTPEVLHSSLARSSQAVKTQLLGQRVVAGVGNIYADEALWRASINPATTRLGLARTATLHAAIVEVLEEGLAHGGTRLRDYESIDGDTGAHQHHLDCYGRAGQPCHRCFTTLRHRVLSGRGTTWCPKCQSR